jgi:DNA-binding NtrC family response regulator
LPGDLTGGSGETTSGGGKVTSQFILPSGGIALDEVEMSLVQQAIERSEGNQTRAAELLRISRDQLRYRLKKLEEAAVVPSERE